MRRSLLPLVSLCMGIAFLPSTTSGAGFRGGHLYPVGRFPVAAATADFDHDGHADLATANLTDASVSVILGTAAGTFGAATDYGTGQPCQDIAAADFDGDGNVDLVAVAGSGTVLFGAGDGTFGGAVSVALGTQPVAVAAGDFNGDGKQDVAGADYGVGGSNAGSLRVALGNGDRTFGPALKLKGVQNPLSVVAGDLNGDAKLDLVAGNDNSLGGNNSVSVFLGNGDGTFQAALKPRLDIVTSSFAALQDLNEDGKADLAVAHQYANAVSALLGNGDGTFQTATTYPVAGSAVRLAVADIDDDSALDILVAGNSGVNLLRGNGGGAFAPASLYGAGINFVVVGSFDGDPGLDVVAASYAAVNVVSGVADGTLRAPRGYSVGSLPNGIAVADFDADGAQDVAIVKQDIGGSLAVLLGNGDGTFDAPLTSSPTSGSPRSVIAGDFDEDSLPDLCVATSGTAVILLGNGDGTFQPSDSLPVGIDPDFQATGDFDHDGHLDLAVNSVSSDEVKVFLGLGDGTFETGTTYAAGDFAESLRAADFNGDGRDDLAVTNPFDDTVSVMLGNADGSFGARVLSPVVAPVYIAAADVNQDGKNDLVVTGSGTSLLLGNGDGTFQTAISIFPDAFGAVELADVDADGTLDLVVSDGGTLGILFAPGNGDGTFQAPVHSYAGVFNGRLALSDFNGDGASDVAVTDTVSNVLILLNSGGDRVAVTSSANPSRAGDPVTFTATVTPTFSDTGTPTGSIVFRDGGTQLAVVPLSDGSASFTTTSLGAGKHGVTATYSGDATFNAGRSTTLKQKVKP